MAMLIRGFFFFTSLIPLVNNPYTQNDYNISTIINFKLVANDVVIIVGISVVWWKGKLVKETI